jgi:phosphopantothenoylcysteine decarboxylase/phosphopantothenate--cysteine ligase
MRLLITAGPTREPIDEVRFISNRSSGRLGIALAEHAAEAGHEVTLLLGPVLIASAARDRLTIERFQTTDELRSLLEAHFRGCDALVMAAAVADYRPRDLIRGKTERGGGLKIELEPTPDLVGAIAPTKRDDQRVIAFALEEPEQLEPRARAKMQRKHVDAIVANPLTTMDADRIDPIWLGRDGGRVAPGPMSKADFAPWLIERVESLFETQSG